MKHITFSLLIVASLFASAFTTLNALNWKISPDYSIKFTSKDPSGEFKSLKGDIVFDEKNPEAAKFDVTIDVASISTGNGMKNTHAKSDKWFDAEKYPTIKFTSSKTSKTATGYEVVGTLDMHGVQKQITLPFTFAGNKFVSSFTINRNDFKIGSGDHVPAELKLDVSVPVSK